MIWWIALFLLIIGISFILAHRSMKDYDKYGLSRRTSGQSLNVEYSLFLIRRTQNFGKEFLDYLHKQLSAEGLIVSFERLFKGRETALTIFGPKKILEQFTEISLLELEDYTLALDSKDISIWEINEPNNIFRHLSELGNEDQFFWQVVLGPKQAGEPFFQGQIRAVLYSKDPLKRKALGSILQSIASNKTEETAFYRSRTLSKDNSGLILDSSAVMRLLKI